MNLVQHHDSHDDIECIGTVPAAPGSRLQFSWGSGTQVRVCEVHSPAAGSGGEDPFGAVVEWSAPIDEQRRIAYDIVPLYKKLRKTLLVLGSGRQDDVREALKDYSAGVLDILTTNASDATAGPPPTSDALQVAYEAGLWQLLELFFLSNDLPDGYFTEAFVAWLGHNSGLLCSPAGYHLLGAEFLRLQEVARVDTDPAYWPLLQRLVLTGQVELALQLLTAHPAYQALQDPDMAAKVEVLEQVYRLLRVVPRFSRQARNSSSMLAAGGALTDDVAAFAAERVAWLSKVHEVFDSRDRLMADLKKLDPAAAKGLAGVLLLLLIGSDSNTTYAVALKHAASVAYNWVELLVGVLMWKYPTLQPQRHFRSLLPAIKGTPGLVNRQCNEEFLAFFEELLLAACDQEVQTVIQLATNSPYCTLQFVAHIYDVLRASPGADRVISRPLPNFGGDQAEMYTLHYVETLAGHAATWQLAAEYLAWCPVHGSAVLEALLDKSPFPMQDDVTALKALAIAQRHGLTGAAAGLARRLGMAAAARGHTAAALQWMMRAHDPTRCAELVAPLLARVQQQLLEQVGNYQVAPLDIPELWDLEPLLAHLPAQPDSEPSRPAAQQHKVQHLVQARPYQELHFLRAFLQLQAALAEVRRWQQQQQQQGLGSTAAATAGQPQQQQAAMAAAYERVRSPVVELLLEGLAPAAMQLPLLQYLLPVFESAYMPFSHADVQGLLQLLGSVTAGELPAAAAAVLAGQHSLLAGLSWPVDAGVPGATDSRTVLHARHVDDVRLALCRSLVKAHVHHASALVNTW